MAKLNDFGFSKDAIFETIVSTYNPDGLVDAAPMGVTMLDQQTISLSLYNSSQTSCNLKTNKCGVINITSDIQIFYRTAFKEANPNGKLPQEWFEGQETMNAPKLRSADATVAFSVVSIAPIGAEKTKFTCNIEQIDASKVYPQVYRRAMAATLEAILHATRVKIFINQKTRPKEVTKLLGLIANSNEIVNHTAPNSMYSKVMADLMKQIGGWRNKP